MITPGISDKILTNNGYTPLIPRKSKSMNNISETPLTCTQLPADIRHTIDDYTQLIEYIERRLTSPYAPTLGTDEARSRVLIQTDLLSHESIETFAMMLVLNSKLILLRSEIKIIRRTYDLITAMHFMNADQYNTYRSMFRQISNSKVFSLPESFRKFALNKLLNVPEHVLPQILNDNCEHRIWYTLYNVIKYHIVPCISERCKTMNALLLNLSIPIIPNQIYQIITTVARNNTHFNIKYIPRQNALYNHIDPMDFSRAVSGNDRHSLTTIIYQFNDNLSALYHRLNHISAAIVKQKEGLIFDDVVPGSTLHGIINAAFNEMDVIISQLLATLNTIQILIERNMNSNVFIMKTTELLLLIYRRLQKFIFTLHNITRSSLGYNKRNRKGRW